MPSYVFTAPDGRKIKVDGPEGSTPEQAFQIAQSQWQPEAAPEPSLGQKIQGGAQVANSMFASAIAEPVAGLAGIAGTLAGMVPGGESPNEKGARYVGAVRDAATRNPAVPMGATGQGYMQNIGEAVEPVFTAIDRGAERMAGGNPLIATALQTAALGAPELLGLKGAGAAGRATGNAARTLADAMPQPKPKAPPAPSIDELKATGRQLYKEVDQAGVVVKGEPITKLANDLAEQLKEAGIDKNVTPEATGALNRLLEDATKPGDMTFSQLETLRKVASNAEGALKPADARLAGLIVDGIDDFIDGLDNAKVSAGDPLTASTSIKKARDYWKRARKAEEIETMFERAKNAVGPTGQGLDEKIRIQFKQLADNKRRFNRFSKAEQAAIKRVVRGGSLDKALGVLALFAPNRTLTALIGGTAGFTLGGGIIPAAMVVGGGELAKRAMSARRVSNATKVDEMVRSGQ